jgi:stress response protein YsnF
VAGSRDAALDGDARFEEDTVDVPLYEEEVRVSKRPYLEEEVVVRTVARSVEHEGSAMLRHEEAEVEDTRKTDGVNREEDVYTDPDLRR